MAEKDKYFAVMRWLNDGNRLSVHSLKHIVEPKLPLTEYKMGMCGEAVYTGYKGLWKFRILAVGEPEKTPKKRQLEHEKTPKKEQSGLEETPKEGQLELENTLKKGQSEPKETPKKGQSEPKETPEKGPSEPEKTPKKIQSEPENKTPKKRRLELFGDEMVPQKSSKFREIEDSESWKTPEKIQLDVLPRRSPRHLEKLEGSDSIKYLSRDEGRKDPSGERIKKLEEEVKSLRKKTRKLDDRIKMLEDAILKPAVHSEAVQSPAAKTSGPTLEIKSVPNLSTPNSAKSSRECPEVFASGDHTDIYKGPSEEQLAKDVSCMTGDQNIFKYLCSKVFSREELISNTRTGKKTIKCMNDTKPPFNPVKFQFLEKMVITHTTLDKNSFYKKLENLQKVLRREKQPA